MGGEAVLRGALVGTARADVHLSGGRIVAVGAALPAPPGADDVDLSGYLLAPSAVEPHAHLDKAFLADAVSNPTGDLEGAIGAMEAAADSYTVADATRRAGRAIALLTANGYTRIRTHVDVTPVLGLGPLRAVLAARSATADVADIEIVAVCGRPVLGAAGASQRALLLEAMGSGADLVGGCPHLEDGGVEAATELFLQVATDVAAGVDLHTDETLDETVCGLATLARRVRTGFAHPVTASHCVSLSMLPEFEQRRIADEVAAAGIGVVALPQTNLYLQARGRTTAAPRGITPVVALLQAGVAVAAGQDNLQDPFNPLGRGCPFEVAALMVAAAHLSPEEAYATVSAGARAVLGMQPVAVESGSPADLLAVRATSTREAIAFGPADRLVWRRGELLAG